MGKQDEDMHKEINDRADGIERHHANVAKETSKRLNALDLRISGLQGASGEQKRDINKLRDEVNNLTVKSAAHDVDIGKNSDDIKKMERQRSEDNQRHKQDMMLSTRSWIRRSTKRTSWVLRTTSASSLVAA